jgi:hypothetical protein
MSTFDFVQFILWPDCNNNCTFCVQPGREKHHDRHKLIELIAQKIPTLSNVDILAVGGELFDSVENELDFDRFFDSFTTYLTKNPLNRVFYMSNLLYKDLELIASLYNKGILTHTLDRIKLSSSYDIEGRFHTEKDKKLWIKNFRILTYSFKDFPLAVNVILTKQAIEYGVVKVYDELTLYGAEWVNFLPGVQLPASMIASRDSIRKSLLELEDYRPGYLARYLEQHLSTQRKIVLTPNDEGSSFIDVTASTAPCEHSINFTDDEGCFICWLQREFDVHR